MTEQASRLEKTRVRTSFSRAAGSYDAAAAFQRSIADELLARLDLIKFSPARVLDVGSGTGYCTRALARRYRDAHIFAADLAHASLVLARRKSGLISRLPFVRHTHFVCGDAEQLPFARDSLDMVLSNLTLQWCDHERVFREFMRVLRPGGLLMFTSLGPDTLKELRAAWETVDSDAHVHVFTDMHDVGDSLVRSGFADPVLDVERTTLTYPDVPALLRDLKEVGAHNAAAGRPHGLTGKERFARFVAAYEAQQRDGRIPASYETIFGHAWAPQTKPMSVERGDGSIGIPIDLVRRP